MPRPPYSPPWTTCGMVVNYLVGSVPALATQLRTLDVGYNFLTDVPAVTYTFCGGVSNCLLTPSKCPNSGAGTSQKPAASCAFCGTSNGISPFCWGAGGVCTANAAAAVAAGTVNALALPLLPLTCVGGPALVTINSADAAAMLNIKGVLGTTYTTWSTTSPCRLENSTVAFAGEWTGVFCTAARKVLAMSFPGTQLKGSFHADISTLTALTFLNLPNNLFNYRLDSFFTNMRALPLLADIRLHYNYFYGEVPSFLVGLPQLTLLGMVVNYLVGSVPALATQLRTLDVGYNFLTDVPAVTYTFCGGVSNCMLTPSKCPNSGAGTTQRPAADLCTANASAAVAAGTVNALAHPLLPLTCVGGTTVAMKAAEAAAMLSVKLALALTFTTWATTNACQLAGLATAPSAVSPARASCHELIRTDLLVPCGRYLKDNGITRKSFPADISKLTTLTGMW
ncbi:unnamed protein product, partial [Closterium sp. Naga37s-1]